MRPAACLTFFSASLGHLVRSAAPLAARPTASRGGMAARAGGLGTTMTITTTTTTTPMAGTG